MILEISDGQSGIKDYLVHGFKKDRKMSREAMDQRVTLEGDLDVTDSIIQTLDYKVNYKHITISWKEDNVTIEEMQRAVDSFKSFMMSAYKSKEYNLYSEAHFPKIKSYKTKNGKLIIRKPHLHIVCPNINLLSQKQLNPLGHVKSNIDFINAWQEYNNLEMGFASPKDNRRNGLNINSEVISRFKGDLFESGVREKLEIIDYILENDICNYQDFISDLKKMGEVKTRNKGKINEYLNFKPPHRVRGINLKEYVFSQEFVLLSKEKKIDFLDKELEEKYIEKTPPKKSKQEYVDLLNQWHTQRALEVKYISKNTKFYKETYKHYTNAQKLEYLHNVHENFYKKHEAKLEVGHQNIDDLTITANIESHNENYIAQKLHDIENEKYFQNKEIEIDMEKVYLVLSQDKGVLKHKYQLIDGKIVAGSKIFDKPKEFLKNEMHFREGDVEFLEQRILTLENQIEGNTMKHVNVNIKKNKIIDNQVDYYQIGTQTVAGRFTGIIHDRSSDMDTAKMYVINDKAVSQELFKKAEKELYESITAKQKELFSIKQEIKYNDKVKCDVVRDKVTLTSMGNVYANSKLNMKEISPIQVGITEFNKKIDKNFFTIAKEFITAKEFRDNLKEAVHDFKQKVKSIITSKPELAASNILMAAELKQLRQNLQEIKTYQAAQEIASQKSQTKQQSQTNKKEISFKELVRRVDKIYSTYEKTKNASKLSESLERLQNLLPDKQHSIVNELIEFKHFEINDAITKDISLKVLQNSENIKDIAAANIMLKNDLKIENESSISKMASTISTAMNIATEQSIDPTALITEIASQMKANQQTKVQER